MWIPPPPPPRCPDRKTYTWDDRTRNWRKKTQWELDRETAMKQLDEEFPGYAAD